MKYNFDKIIDRVGSDAIKVDNVELVFGKKDLIPMWVADMDFETPQFIRDAVVAQTCNSVWGYTKPSDAYWCSIQNWLTRRYNWLITREQVGFVGGIVPGLSFAVNAFTQLNDKVIIQTPVYPPFHSVVKSSGRKLLCNPLKIIDGKFQMDFEQLEKLMINESPKMLILCNPHNPGGRSWSNDELTELAELCSKYNVLVVSDEIHADLTHKGFTHNPFAQVSEKAKDICITFMAPSKTFNMAGLSSSFYIIENEALMLRFQNYVLGNDLTCGHMFAFVAAKAAFDNGEEWLFDALDYIDENIKFVETYLQENIPGIQPMIPEASFLIWLDFSKTGLTHSQIKECLINEARVAFNDGLAFGEEGRFFMRMNVGCPRSIIAEVLERLKKVFNKQGYPNK